MAAFKVNLTLDQGATNRRLWTWKVGAPLAPMDLTGCTAEAHFRAYVSSPDILMSLSTTDGSIVLGDAAGTVELVFEPATTQGVTPLSGVFDVEITFPSTEVRRLAQGKFTISPESTRAV